MKSLTGFYQNVRGLNTKLSTVTHHVSHCMYDILFLTETWLSDNINSNELGMTNYNIFRMDRSCVNNRLKSQGGGVLVAVAKNIAAEQWNASDTVEQVFVILPNLKLILGCIYLPDYQSPGLLERHFDDLDAASMAYPNFNILLAGDYNTPGVAWDSWNSESSPSIMGPKARIIFDAMRLHHLHQHNHVPNVSNNFIDLVLSDVTCMDLRGAEPLVAPDVAHPPIEFLFQASPGTEEVFVSDRFQYNFKKGNYEAINVFLSKQDWSVLEGLPLEQAIEAFYGVLFSALKQFVPQTKIINRSFAKWFSVELINLTKLKRLAHARSKLSGIWEDYLTFSALRQQCNSLSERDYSAFVDSVQSLLQTNLKEFWNFVNYRDGVNSLPDCMSFNGTRGKTPQESAELFASFFSSVYDAPASSVPLYPSCDVTSIGSLEVTAEDVLRELEALDPAKGVGPDGVPPCLLQKCCLSLVRPLTLLFNKSLTSGCFPTRWKESYITPIHKSGKRSLVDNYRAICTISTVPKMFERIVVGRLTPLFSSYIVPEQHGFTKGRSTVTNLLEFTDFVFSSFQSNTQVDVISVDFAKAFDRVSHRHILSLLYSLGVHGALLAWIGSYLIDRSLRVRLKSTLSSPYHASSGIPQGSHIGPLLFLLLINGVSTLTLPSNTRILIFADDIKVFTRVSSSNDCHLLQQCLDSILDWCSINSLSLNPAKCTVSTYSRSHEVTVFSYSLEGSPLKRLEVTRDLGVLFDPMLTFNDHVDAVTSKALKVLGFVKRCTRDFTSPEAIVTLYKSLVRPVMEYASPVWSPFYREYIDRLEKVQRRFLRYLAYRIRIPADQVDLEALAGRFNLPRLEHRRLVTDVIFYHKLVTGGLQCPKLLAEVGLNVPSYAARRIPLFKVPFAAFNYQMHRPMYRIPRLVNAFLDSSNFDFFTGSLHGLKRQLSDYLRGV